MNAHRPTPGGSAQLYAAWWFVAVATVAFIVTAWSLVDWLSRPDPWGYLDTIGRRSAGFRVLSIPVLLGTAAEVLFALFRPAVRLNHRKQRLECRRYVVFSSYRIPLVAIKGLRVHRYGLEHGVTILSALDPPVIPVRLPRNTTVDDVERDLRAGLGLHNAGVASSSHRPSTEPS